MKRPGKVSKAGKWVPQDLPEINKQQRVTYLMKAARSFVCKDRKEVNEINGDEVVPTRKRKEHCQRSADSLRAPGFVRRVHGMMEESRGKSICNILPKIFKSPKKQQYLRNVIHQDLEYKSFVLRKLKHSEEQECLWFFSDEKKLPPG
ncbi:hypothetical protein ACTXT7_007881 [Hymenolepis weldensis]